MEVTGKNQDECMVALHDCNEDVGRAINFLLESTSDMVSNSPATSLFHPLTAGKHAAGQTGILAASAWLYGNPKMAIGGQLTLCIWNHVLVWRRSANLWLYLRPVRSYGVTEVNNGLR